MVIWIDIDKYDDLDKQIEGCGFSFKFFCTINIRCQKVNVSRGSFIKSLDWLKSNKSTQKKIDVFNLL